MKFLRTLFKIRKKILLGFITLGILYLTVNAIIERENSFWNPPGGQFNYFTETESYLSRPEGFIVNTPTCQILNIDPWEKSVKHLLSEGKELDCYTKHRHWSYVRGPLIVVNKTAVLESGYSMGSISCCYKTIHRIEQSPDNYNTFADRRVKYSSSCSVMSFNETQVKQNEEFVEVICTSRYWPFRSDTVYRQFHALVLQFQSPAVMDKINLWSKKERTRDDSPNVVIIGVDSISRLHFHRSLPNTKAVLERIGAVEMMGYTKVGDNTLPNSIPLLTGYSAEELEKMCYFSPRTKFDSCPFIWKDFASADYLTAHNEDVPFLAAFNYKKTGFVEKPTDFYLRPFMLGVSLHTDNVRNTFDCIGYEAVHDTVINYNVQLLNLSHATNTPIFLSSWMTGLAHQDWNAAKFADSNFVNFFNELDQSGILENTILFFMSDHGYRYGQIRQTFPGWYEDKLPFLWVHVPHRLRKRLDVDSILRKNGRRLSSSFDVYQTMTHVLQLYSPGSINNTSSSILRTKGQSFLQEIPFERKCSDAGIPNGFCACVMPKPVNVSDVFLLNASNAAVSYLNKIIPPQCSPLSVSSISAGALLKKYNNSNTTTYVVTFTTKPGNFLFEASVDVDYGTETFSVAGNILRLSKFDRDVSCAKSHFYELYCYCP